MSQGLIKKGLLSGAVIAAAVSAVPTTSDAALVYDMRIVSGGTAAGTGTGAARTITGTGTVLVEVWARVSGTDGNNANEGLLANYVSLRSSEVSGDAFTGSLSTTGAGNGRTSPFNGNGTRNGGAVDANGDGVDDWGAGAALTNTTYMLARSDRWTRSGTETNYDFVANDGSFRTIGNQVDADTWEFKIARFSLNVTSLTGAGDTRLAIVKPDAPADPAYAVYADDAALAPVDPADPSFGQTIAPGAQSDVNNTNFEGVYGDFVTISVIPEPTTLALLGLGGLGLLARRRRD